MNQSPSSAACADSPKAVLFDAYGTLFDVYSVSALAEQLFPTQGNTLSILWRDKQIESEFTKCSRCCAGYAVGRCA